ncbi:MAG: class II aldolase/adducin family protein [Holophagaceae bacterium]|nr:class II aldolase/adducin family protein [Holophagaceae bacterium]
MDEPGILNAMVEACRRLHARNLLAAADGNISCRLPFNRIAITPAGVNKAQLRAQDMAFMQLNGLVIKGKPSSERLMHQAVYRACPEAFCVVHAHPPTAIAWSLARPDLEFLPDEALPEVILAAGRIPIVPYARPGTAAMGEALAEYLPQHRLMILARHGALCWGETIEDAYNGIERLEHVCQILKSATELGGLHSLPPGELAALRELRARQGPKIL